jgi:cobalt-zinc-cadmium efflux system membrane fusion protein
MTSHTMTIDRRTAAAASLGLLLVGAAGTLAWLKAGSSQPPTAMALAEGNAPARIVPPPSDQSSTSASDTAVTLSPEAVTRAGIVVSKIDVGSEAAFLRVPGVVEANHYRQVAVTALAAGRVTKVQAELGQDVRRGQSLASIYSPELAEARARFGAARAELEAHDRELQRTQKLAAIGAASRQELDRIHAEHTAQLAMVESARARLELLGGRSAVDRPADAGPSTTVDVLAPLDGTITERSANAGLNVEAGTPLFTVADLSTVWVVAELFEQDFARVRVGTPVTVTVPAYADLRLQARVSYIDPQVSAATRTAKVRVELPNVGQQLRLGMYADVQVGVSSAADLTGVTVPRAAVQTVGDRSVVYVASAGIPGQFVERAVRLGDAAGAQVRIVSGLTAGESVVVGGSFFIRAEAERLGLRPRSTGSPPQEAPSLAAAPSGQAKPPAEQRAQVTITEKGFEPTKVELRVGVPATLTFARVTDTTCAKEIVFPSLKLRKPLPLNQPVDVRFTPAAAETAFACGMDMLKGTVVAR